MKTARAIAYDAVEQLGLRSDPVVMPRQRLVDLIALAVTEGRIEVVTDLTQQIRDEQKRDSDRVGRAL